MAWVCGYVAESFKVTFVIWLLGLVVAMILCVPDWPMFNRHPVDWLKEIPTAKTATAPPTDDAPTDKKKSKTKKRQ